MTSACQKNNGYTLKHGNVTDVFGIQDLFAFKSWGGLRTAKETVKVEYYIKKIETADYYNSLYIEKGVTGVEIYRSILCLFIKRLESERKREDMTLHNGTEIKKTFLFPRNFLKLDDSNCSANELDVKNHSMPTVDVSPVTVWRQVGCGGTLIEIESNVVYELNYEETFL